MIKLSTNSSQIVVPHIYSSATLASGKAATAPDAAIATPLAAAAAFLLLEALVAEPPLGVEVRDLAEEEEVNLSSLGASNSLRMSPSML